jgi:hypothetical protein
MDELSRKWSELIRELNTRDVEPVPPADIYGRNYDVDPVFVTAGTSLTNPAPPLAGYWFRYTYSVPADAGLVLVQPVSVSTAANVQILNTLPPASFSEGRTITIALDTLSPVSGYTNFNMAIGSTPGSGDAIIPLSPAQVNVNNTVTGSITVNTTVSTRLNNVGGSPIPASAGGALRLESRTSAGVFTGMVAGIDFGAGILYPAENSFTNNTTVSVIPIINVSSTASYAPPINYTFRAFRNKWVQIA